ncbi:MAG: hypothetical protein VX624_00460 [Pseudomonadota bacterium]|nr:hypothetical protein [Pseudomonadota bacterium]
MAGAQDPVRCAIQRHYQPKFNEIGQTAFVGEWDQVDSATTSSDTAKAYAFSIQQGIYAADMEILGKYSHFELDRDSSDLDDIDAISVDTQLKF